MEKITVFILYRINGILQDARSLILEGKYIHSFEVDSTLYKNFLKNEEISDGYLRAYSTHDFLWNDESYEKFKKFLVLQELNNEVLNG